MLAQTLEAQSEGPGNSFEALGERAAAARNSRGREIREIVARVAPGIDRSADSIVGGSDGETPASFALLHHALYEMRAATDSKDADRLRGAFDVAAASTKYLGADAADATFLAIDAADCRRIEDARFGSTIFTIVPGALAPSSRLPAQLVDEACTAVRDSGYQHYLAHGLGTVIFSEHSEAGGSAFSYSLGAFPHTVFTDWSDDPIIVGECLVHEGSHAWLNGVFAASDEDLPPEPIAYSPWKDKDRPAYGLIHAALAFSILTNYFRSCMTSSYASTDARRYCEIREDVERRRVTMAHEGIELALSHVRSPEIVEVIRSEMETAMQAQPSRR